jgi:hypothetical protein
MSYPLKRLNPIHDPKSNLSIAHDILMAIECETLNLVWLLPLSCAILLNKAISEENLSIQEQLILRGLRLLIRKPKQVESWIESMIDCIFYEIIDDEENEDDYSKNY